MRKNIREFHEGDMIYLFACGRQRVVGNPWTDEQGHTFLLVTIMGLKFVQLLKFDWRDEFEWSKKEEL